MKRVSGTLDLSTTPPTTSELLNQLQDVEHYRSSAICLVNFAITDNQQLTAVLKWLSTLHSDTKWQNLVFNELEKFDFFNYFLLMNSSAQSNFEELIVKLKEESNHPFFTRLVDKFVETEKNFLEKAHDAETLRLRAIESNLPVLAIDFLLLNRQVLLKLFDIETILTAIDQESLDKPETRDAILKKVIESLETTTINVANFFNVLWNFSRQKRNIFFIGLAAHYAASEQAQAEYYNLLARHLAYLYLLPNMATKISFADIGGKVRINGMIERFLEGSASLHKIEFLCDLYSKLKDSDAVVDRQSLGSLEALPKQIMGQLNILSAAEQFLDLDQDLQDKIKRCDVYPLVVEQLSGGVKALQALCEGRKDTGTEGSESAGDNRILILQQMRDEWHKWEGSRNLFKSIWPVARYQTLHPFTVYELIALCLETIFEREQTEENFNKGLAATEKYLQQESGQSPEEVFARYKILTTAYVLAKNPIFQEQCLVNLNQLDREEHDALTWYEDPRCLDGRVSLIEAALLRNNKGAIDWLLKKKQKLFVGREILVLAIELKHDLIIDLSLEGKVICIGEANTANLALNLAFTSAALRGYVDIVKKYVTLITKKGVNDALELAVGFGCLEIVETLLAHEGENKPTVEGVNNALQLAVLARHNNNLIIIQTLLAHKGENKPTVDGVNKSLSLAAQRGCLGNVKTFLAHKGENKPTVAGVNKALQSAVASDQLIIVKTILAHEGENKPTVVGVNAALKSAALGDQLIIVKTILGHEGKNKPTVEGVNAVFKLAVTDCLECVKTFLEHEGENKLTVDCVNNALSLAAFSSSDCIKKFLAHEGENKPTVDGVNEALSLAAQSGYSGNVKTFLAHKGENKPTVAGVNKALQSAAASDQLIIVKTILAHKGENKPTVAGVYSALQLAIFRGNLEVIETLLELEGENKLTVLYVGALLYFAVDCGYLEVVKTFLAHEGENKPTVACIHLLLENKKNSIQIDPSIRRVLTDFIEEANKNNLASIGPSLTLSC